MYNRLPATPHLKQLFLLGFSRHLPPVYHSYIFPVGVYYTRHRRQRPCKAHIVNRPVEVRQSVSLCAFFLTVVIIMRWRRSIGHKFNYLVFCPRIFIILPPLPRKHYWTAIGCTEIGQIGQPIGMTVHSHWRDSFESEEWITVDIKKAQIFLNTL